MGLGKWIGEHSGRNYNPGSFNLSAENIFFISAWLIVIGIMIYSLIKYANKSPKEKDVKI